MVPSATMTIKEATVFIGIWTAASSLIFNGFLDINYLVHNQSTNFFQGQQIAFQIFLTMLSSSCKIKGACACPQCGHTLLMLIGVIIKPIPQFSHFIFFSPQSRKRIYQYPLFSRLYYLLRSIRLFALSNQEYYLSQ
jgi:hypothetical protein